MPSRMMLLRTDVLTKLLIPFSVNSLNPIAQMLSAFFTALKRECRTRLLSIKKHHQRPDALNSRFPLYCWKLSWKLKTSLKVCSLLNIPFRIDLSRLCGTPNASSLSFQRMKIKQSLVLKNKNGIGKVKQVLFESKEQTVWCIGWSRKPRFAKCSHGFTTVVQARFEGLLRRKNLKSVIVNLVIWMSVCGSF